MVNLNESCSLIYDCELVLVCQPMVACSEFEDGFVVIVEEGCVTMSYIGDDRY